MKIDLSRFRDTFFEEAADHLTTMEAGLLRLEAAPDARDLLHEIFRAAHSIKGASGTLGLTDVLEFTHALEGLLDLLRAGKLPVTPAVIDLLLRSRDVVDGLLAAARDGSAPPTHGAAVRGELEQAMQAKPGPAPSAPAASAPRAGATDAVYTISFKPHPDLLRQGNDPLLLLRELAELGELTETQLDLSALPPLEALDPESCHLAWATRLRTEKPATAIDDVFLFVNDCCEVCVQPVASPGPRAPAGTPSAFFGTFLVRRGLVSAEQVMEAVEWQHRTRPMLGRIAADHGWMTVHQIFDVLNQMSSLGLRFGETAVRLGYLTDERLEELLIKQRPLKPLGEVLVEAGALTRERLEEALATYRRERDESWEEAAPASLVPVTSQPAAEFAPAYRDMLAEFCGEAEEHLEAVDRHLLGLDHNPTDKETLNAIYRAFHTIKGVAGMFDLTAMSSLAHEAESLLNATRDGAIVLQGQPLDLVFASVDGLRRQVGFIRAWLAVGKGALATDAQLPGLIAQLRAVLKTDDEPEQRAGGVRPRSTDTTTAGAEPPGANAPRAPEAPEVRATSSGDKETVRVDRGRLDKLINAIGELVISQSMVQQELDDHMRHCDFHSRALPELTKIARDLQELSLSLRMVPLQGTFQKIARIVRDLSKKIAKPVHFRVEGEETELDKTVVDRLGDPLVHMVRNAVDHGIEPADVRLAAGKAAEGTVNLRAFHQGGNVHIELTDDGKGLDRKAILAKAVERGLVTEGQVLTDPEVFALIFEPGFSTAKVVTDVSGRGVGMDVVRRNVEALQGSIHIRSTPGKGTTFTIRLPLTLAIMDGLSVGLMDDVYILPLLSVIESFQPRPADVHKLAGQGEVVVVRGEPVPLLRLHRLLDRPARVTEPRGGLVVLVENQGKKYALLVDELLGQLQVVMKSLDTNFQKVEGLAGATILGDGRVAMILDVHGLTRLSTGGGTRDRAPAMPAGAEQ